MSGGRPSHGETVRCLNCTLELDEHRHPDSACPLPREYRGFHAGFSDVLTFDPATVVLGREEFDAFVALLDRAPRGLSSLPRLVALMQRPSPFQPSLFDDDGDS